MSGYTRPLSAGSPIRRRVYQNAAGERSDTPFYPSAAQVAANGAMLRNYQPLNYQPRSSIQGPIQAWGSNSLEQPVSISPASFNITSEVDGETVLVHREDPTARGRWRAELRDERLGWTATALSDTEVARFRVLGAEQRTLAVRASPMAAGGIATAWSSWSKPESVSAKAAAAKAAAAAGGAAAASAATSATSAASSATAAAASEAAAATSASQAVAAAASAASPTRSSSGAQSPSLSASGSAPPPPAPEVPAPTRVASGMPVEEQPPADSQPHDAAAEIAALKARVEALEKEKTELSTQNSDQTKLITKLEAAATEPSTPKTPARSRSGLSTPNAPTMSDLEMIRKVREAIENATLKRAAIGEPSAMRAALRAGRSATSGSRPAAYVLMPCKARSRTAIGSEPSLLMLSLLRANLHSHRLEPCCSTLSLLALPARSPCSPSLLALAARSPSRSE